LQIVEDCMYDTFLQTLHCSMKNVNWDEIVLTSKKPIQICQEEKKLFCTQNLGTIQLLVHPLVPTQNTHLPPQRWSIRQQDR
jgi:hypothetical protein